MDKLKEKLLYFLTGTETPLHLTEREKVMIDKFLVFHRIHKEEDMRKAFYKGREIKRYNERGLAIFERPTFEGYLRELSKKDL